MNNEKPELTSNSTTEMFVKTEHPAPQVPKSPQVPENPQVPQLSQIQFTKLALTDNLNFEEFMEMRKTHAFNVVYCGTGEITIPITHGMRIYSESELQNTENNYKDFVNECFDELLLGSNSIEFNDVDIDSLAEIDVDSVSVDSLLDDNNALHRKLRKEGTLLTRSMLNTIERQADEKKSKEAEFEELLAKQAEEERLKAEREKQAKEEELKRLEAQRLVEEERIERERKLEEERIERERKLEEERILKAKQLEEERIAKAHEEEMRKIELQHQEEMLKLEQERIAKEEQLRLEEERLKREEEERNRAIELQKAEEERKRFEEERKRREEEERLERERQERLEQEEYERKLEEEKRNADLEIQRRERELKLQEIEFEKQRKLTEMEYNTQSKIAKFSEDVLVPDIMMPESFPFVMPIFKCFMDTSNSAPSKSIKMKRSKTSNSDNGRVYIVASAIEDSFGTTTAYNFAIEMKKLYNQPVLLLDLDMDKTALSYRFKLKHNIQKAFSMDFEQYLTELNKYVDSIEIGGTTIDMIGCKPISRMNSMYKSQLMSYDFNNLLFNLGRVYPIIIVDVGCLSKLDNYKTSLFNSPNNKKLVCYNIRNVNTLRDSVKATSKLKPNWVALMCNNNAQINELTLSKKLNIPIAGIIPYTNVVGNPVYRNSVNQKLLNSWNSIINKISR